MQRGPMFRMQSQVHFGVLSVGQSILQVSLIPAPHDTISHLFELSAISTGGSFMMTGGGSASPPSFTGGCGRSSASRNPSGTRQKTEAALRTRTRMKDRLIQAPPVKGARRIGRSIKESKRRLRKTGCLPETSCTGDSSPIDEISIDSGTFQITTSERF